MCPKQEVFYSDKFLGLKVNNSIVMFWYVHILFAKSLSSSLNLYNIYHVINHLTISNFYFLNLTILF